MCKRCLAVVLSLLLSACYTGARMPIERGEAWHDQAHGLLIGSLVVNSKSHLEWAEVEIILASLDHDFHGTAKVNDLIYHEQRDFDFGPDRMGNVFAIELVPGRYYVQWIRVGKNIIYTSNGPPSSTATIEPGEATYVGSFEFSTRSNAIFFWPAAGDPATDVEFGMRDHRERDVRFFRQRFPQLDVPEIKTSMLTELGPFEKTIDRPGPVIPIIIVK